MRIELVSGFRPTWFSSLGKNSLDCCFFFLLAYRLIPLLLALGRWKRKKFPSTLYFRLFCLISNSRVFFFREGLPLRWMVMCICWGDYYVCSRTFGSFKLHFLHCWGLVKKLNKFIARNISVDCNILVTNSQVRKKLSRARFWRTSSLLPSSWAWEINVRMHAMQSSRNMYISRWMQFTWMKTAATEKFLWEAETWYRLLFFF